MSLNVAMLEAMEAEGLDLAACIRILKAGEPLVDEQAERRRAADRERAKGRRERVKSADSTADRPQTLPPKEETSNPRSDPDGSAPPIDPVKAMFDLGVSLLVAEGRKERAARSLVGKWRNALGDEKLRRLLMSATGKTDLAAYVEAAIRNDGRETDEHVDGVLRKYGGGSG